MMDLQAEQLLSRVQSLYNKFRQCSETRYIDEAIVLAREALSIHTPGHPQRPYYLVPLAWCIWTRYEQLGGMENIHEAIVLGKEALALCTPGHPYRSVSLNNLAVCLWSQYLVLGGVEDLNEAIRLNQDALALRPPGNPDRSMSLNNLALHLGTRYDGFGGIEDLNEAICLDREAVALRPPGHPDRSMSLNNLAVDLWTRYNTHGAVEDLEEAICLDRDALTLRPPGHPDRSKSLNNLATHLGTRYSELGGVEDLDEAIYLHREALALRPPGHPGRSWSLSDLALDLWTRFNKHGAVEDLDEAICLSRDVLALRLPGHPARSKSLNNLANYLGTRHNELGGVEDLDEAICLHREALTLHSPGHPDRSRSLGDLALDLWARFNKYGAVDDLDEAIRLSRDALALRLPGHPDRSKSLNNLANYLSTRYNELGGFEDLDEAICLHQEALALRSPGHPERSWSLNDLAHDLWIRFNEHGAVEDLDEAIRLNRNALALRLPGHPALSMTLNNLAVYLWARYNKRDGVEGLNEVIRVDRDALALRPPGHPGRSMTLNNLATHLSIRYKKVALLLGIIGNCTHCLSFRSVQLREAEDREEIFRLYGELARASEMRTVSSDDISAAKAWIDAAEEFHHLTTHLAYGTGLRLLVHHLATVPPLPQHLTVFKGLTSSLAVDAFSACLRNQSPTNAVELLEQGRGVFWSQLTRLRSPLDDVIASGSAGKMLADEFMRVTSLIRNVLDSPGADQHDRVWRLNLELQRVLSNIRNLPGHSRFLHPLLFSDLQRAASGGPVIIVNASKYSCDALLVFADKDPVHIPLSVTKQDVRGLSSKLSELTSRAKKANVTKDIGVILRELWDKVVSPIADFLLTTYPPHSRVWWCPTAEFSLLPLHAAGAYRKGQHSFKDLYISSYTPTLGALIRARRQHPSDLGMGQKHFLGVGQATAKGESKLLSVSIELTNIGRCVDGLAMFTRIEGEESCISRVAEDLGKNQWVHLACHGLANRKQPFTSAFALHDGHFTIQRIIQCDLKDPEFAYLSACHTTVGDEESPDEVIHLASAMQFAGFRSVIGTMWAVDDAEANKITSVFYTHMIDDLGRLDHTRAAYALWKTMRMVDVPFDQRILYIHLGA